MKILQSSRFAKVIWAAVFMMVSIFMDLSIQPQISAAAAAWTGSSFAGGSGTRENPYQIATADQLNYLALGVNEGINTNGVYFKLTRIIDLKNTSYSEWSPIGNSTYPFKGTFTSDVDSNGMPLYEIKNFKITGNSTLANVGLFGYTTGATIKNIRLASVTVESTRLGGGGDYTPGVGILIGYADGNTTINNCSTSGTISSRNNHTGGLVGKIVSGTVTSSYSTANVTGGTYGTGGLIGNMQSGVTVRYCFSTGIVAGSSETGGLVGGAIGGTIDCCYTLSTVPSGNGFTGYSGTTVTNCYAAGASRTAFYSSTTNSYYDSTKYTGSNGGVGKTTANLWNCFDGTAAESSWIMDQDKYVYPQLAFTQHLKLLPPSVVIAANQKGTEINPVGIGEEATLPNTDLNWSKNISSIKNEDSTITLNQDYTISENGKIIFKSSALSAGKNSITILAEGYEDKLCTIYGAETLGTVTYTVSFASNGGSTVAPVTAVSGSAITVPTAPTRSGYTFSGWYKETECRNAWSFESDTVAGNITLYAKWTPEAVVTYTVSFASNGGSAVAPVTAASGSAITVPTAPLRSGYTFSGWYKEAECRNAWSFESDTVAGNITLYAKWTPEAVVTYTVSFASNGGSAVAQVTAVSGSAITVPTAPTRSGYTFSGWYKEAGYVNLWSFERDTVAGDITLFAKWSPEAVVSYTVSFASNGGSTVAPVTAVSGSAITVPTAPTRSGYTFSGWYKQAEYTHAWNFGSDIVTGDIILYAKWMKNENTSTNTPVSSTSGGSSPYSTEKINIDIKLGDTENILSQISMLRETDAAGKKKDTVIYSEEKVTETVAKLQKEGKNTARIVIPDMGEGIVETKVVVPSKSVEALAEGGISLQIETPEVKMNLTGKTLKSIDSSREEELYFRLIPAQGSEEIEKLKNRAVLQLGSISGNTGDSFSVIGNPITIDTNMPSTEADITLPLTGFNLPADLKQRKALLDQLAVYIEHSDGEKELVRGELVEFAQGKYGIKFHINKYSTFTVIRTDALVKSSDCNIIKITSPVKAKGKGTKITAVVKSTVSSITVKAEVSKNAVWELYRNKACTILIRKNKLTLKTGVNTAYIKVTAEDGTEKVYKLTVTRKKSSEAHITKVKVHIGRKSIDPA